MPESLADLLKTVNTYRGSWKETQLVWDVNRFLWATYDPHDDFMYPNIKGWDDLLLATMDANSYDRLSKDEVLSILFGLHHRNRIVDGLWWSMFERGVTQRLLERLLVLDVGYCS